MMNKTYFLYLIKKNYKKMLAFAGIFAAFFTMACIMANDYGLLTYSNPYDVNDAYVTFHPEQYTSTCLYFITIAGIAAACIVPVFMRAMVLKKSRCDTYFSLPVKRWKMYLTNYVFGLAAIIVCLIPAFLLGIAVFLLRGMPFNYAWFLAYFGAIILYIASFYAISSFVTIFANNFADAFLFSAMAFLIPLMLLLCFNLSDMDVAGTIIAPVYGADKITTFFEKRCLVLTDSFKDVIVQARDLPFRYNYDSFTTEMAISLIMQAVIALVLPIFAVLVSGKFKAEHAEEPSDRYFANKWMTAIFTVLLFIMFDRVTGIGADLSTSIIYKLIVCVLWLIGTFIFNKKVRLSRVDVIFFIGTLIVGNGLGILLLYI